MASFKQFVPRTATEIALDFISHFDALCKQWLDDPNMSEETIIEYQNSPYWMMVIGQFFGKVIGIARNGVGGQLVAVRGKAPLWKNWLAKLDAIVSDEHFQLTKKQIEKFRVMRKYNESLIGSYLGPDELAAVKIFESKQTTRK
jgi:hypothetical protein